MKTSRDVNPWTWYLVGTILMFIVAVVLPFLDSNPLSNPEKYFAYVCWSAGISVLSGFGWYLFALYVKWKLMIRELYCLMRVYFERELSVEHVIWDKEKYQYVWDKEIYQQMRRTDNTW